MISSERLVKLIGLLTVILLLSNCNSINAAKEPKLKQSVHAAEFNGIALICPASLSYVESENTSIVVNTTKEVFDEMGFETVDGLLEISFKNNTIIANPETIDIIIHAPNIDKLIMIGSGSMVANYDILSHHDDVLLEVVGSGDIRATNLNTKSCDFRIAGSGNIDSKDFTAEKIKASVTGSGDIRTSGTCHSTKVEIAGSGSYNGYSCQTYEAKVNMTGSGNCEVDVLDNIKINIAGSGDVCYRGTPKVVSDITGSGAVHQK
jgi:hypothetical protein